MNDKGDDDIGEAPSLPSSRFSWIHSLFEQMAEK